MITFFASLSIALLFLYGGSQVVTDRLSLGDFVSFSFYIQLLVWPLMASGWVLNVIQRGLASVNRILELADRNPDISLPENGSRVSTRLGGHILMRGLCFSYPGENDVVLRDINIDIKKGGSLGILGKPGSGKTTLVSLMFRLFPVERGMLFIDNCDINDIGLEILRASIGYVPQDSFLFSDTIENNIAFGAAEGTDFSQIRRAAEIASINGDIESFPNGYATLTGERGITLSGGQKQRIAIARAIVSKPPILVFDDALSSVDAGTERLIKNALAGEMAGRTSIIIAHRISTVCTCDSIIVLDKGNIIERGTHQELCALGGFYSRLDALQKMRDSQE
jgi:ATP-binding cassette, subfamily B, multidrug efflux pump